MLSKPQTLIDRHLGFIGDVDGPLKPTWGNSQEELADMNYTVNEESDGQ